MGVALEKEKPKSERSILSSMPFFSLFNRLEGKSITVVRQQRTEHLWKKENTTRHATINITRHATINIKKTTILF